MLAVFLLAALGSLEDPAPVPVPVPVVVPGNLDLGGRGSVDVVVVLILDEAELGGGIEDLVAGRT